MLEYAAACGSPADGECRYRAPFLWGTDLPFPRRGWEAAAEEDKKSRPGRVGF